MKQIPLFPLNIVAFPGEDINLHVFEPRYRQLINDCLEEDSTFGIPSYINNKIEMGTEVEIVEVAKEYSDGRMDVRTKALGAFQVQDYWNPWNDKLYAGGEITYVDNSSGSTDLVLLLRMKELVNELFVWLQEPKVPNVATAKSVFDLGHKIGLKIEEEYQLLKMSTENDRLEFVVQHLENLLPALERAHIAQEKIKQNGHFKHLDPLEF
ncbi:MAG: LON peptidase substrate-binding domain-containing protein [Bacteroidota bacterium]